MYSFNKTTDAKSNYFPFTASTQNSQTQAQAQAQTSQATQTSQPQQTQTSQVLQPSIFSQTSSFFPQTSSFFPQTTQPAQQQVAPQQQPQQAVVQPVVQQIPFQQPQVQPVLQQVPVQQPQAVDANLLLTKIVELQSQTLKLQKQMQTSLSSLTNQSKIVFNRTCDGCRSFSITGVIHTALNHHGYDLCSDCYKKSKPPGAIFVTITSVEALEYLHTMQKIINPQK